MEAILPILGIFTAGCAVGIGLVEYVEKKYKEAMALFLPAVFVLALSIYTLIYG